MSHSSVLNGVRVIDGGLASELEYLGARIDGPLWSAHVLEDEPEKVLAVHRAYIAAGSQCIATCSYQVSRMGYAEVGFSPERADAALLRSVELARSAAAEFPGRKVLVAGSLGPYGAALHNGAEYHGNYNCSYDDLVRFHRERIEVFAHATCPQAPDLLPRREFPCDSAFETFPSLEEVRAVGEAMAALAGIAGVVQLFVPRRETRVAWRTRCGVRRAGCGPAADCSDRRELRSATMDSFADRRIAQGFRSAHHGLSQLRRGMGCGGAMLDGEKRAGGVWNAGGGVVCRRSADRGRLLPHAAGAYRRGGASG